MKYNFDEKIDRRGTNAMKLEGYKSYIFHADDSLVLPFTDEEFIHMWVADMEFATPPEILDAIRDRLDRKILGYTANLDSRLYDALSAWCKERYDFTFKESELVISHGVVPAIVKAIELIVGEGQKVLFNTPSYGQFANAARMNEREFVTSPLIKNEDGSYRLDFEDLDKKMADSDTLLFIFCNPHNPTGMIYSEEDLEKLAELVRKHDMWVVSDEIHCDIRRKDAPRHIPFAKILSDYYKLITCMAASKTFNVAGLEQSSILIRDDDLRLKWKANGSGLVNPLSHEGTIAAYEKGGEWLKEMTEYLDGNFKLLNEYFAEHLPEALVTPSETTYLGWVDFSSYFEPDEDVELFFAEVAGVLIEADKAFVADANRMVRLNLACPRDYVREGLEKMADAVNNKHDEKFIGGVHPRAL